CCTSNEKEWGLFHDGDAWLPYARFHAGTSSSCSQGSEDHTLKTALPRTIASGGTLGRPWNEVRVEIATGLKVEPAAVRHLFVSPKQNLAVAIGGFGIAVLGVENAHVRSVLKVEAFDNACIPVMEQWSLGRFVAAWDAVAQKEAPASMPA